MPLAKLKATAVTAKAPPTATIQPVRSSSRRSRLRTAIPMPPTSASPSSHPAWPPSASFSSRSGPVEPPKAPPPPMPPGPPAWPSSRPKPLYSRISEKTLLSVVPAIQGRLEAGVSSTITGQARPTATSAAPAASSWRSATAAAARRDPEPGQRHPRHDHQRRAHLRLEAEADADAGEDQPAGAPVLQRPHERPQRGDAAEHQQRVGVVVAGDRDRDRGQRQHQPGDGARRRGPSGAGSGRTRERPRRRPSAPAARGSRASCSRRL